MLFTSTQFIGFIIQNSNKKQNSFSEWIFEMTFLSCLFFFSPHTKNHKRMCLVLWLIIINDNINSVLMAYLFCTLCEIDKKGFFWNWKKIFLRVLKHFSSTRKFIAIYILIFSSHREFFHVFISLPAVCCYWV